MNDIVVLDTNVLVSGLISPHGNPATIIRMILAKKVRIILDSRVFQEYESVLKRPKVGFLRMISRLCSHSLNMKECGLYLPRC